MMFHALAVFASLIGIPDNSCDCTWLYSSILNGPSNGILLDYIIVNDYNDYQNEYKKLNTACMQVQDVGQ